MEIEISAEAKAKGLNRMVAITVVALSIVMGLCGVKDGNIVQAMQQAQSDAVDAWGEYQATKTKLHIDETALAQNQLLSALSGPKAGGQTKAEASRLEQEIGKYKGEYPALKQKAQDFEAQYDALNVHDDQFDAADALISIAISIAAVAALADAAWTLYAAWGFGALGVAMGLSGFMGWSLHSAFLSKILS